MTTTYDFLGNVTALTDHDSKGILYTRDAEGRVTKESHNDGSTTEYAYNAAGLLTQQKEVDRRNATRREILYGYDDAGNLKSEQRSGVDVDQRDENVRYYYDRANRLIKTIVEGQTTEYRYDLAGNLPDDGKYIYTYDLQKHLLTKKGGKVKQKRYYGPDGRPELDIDYNHPNNDGTHEFDWNMSPSRLPGVPF